MAEAIISRDDARAQGLLHFYTGQPCRHGHLCRRYVRDGKCFDCLAKRAAVRGKLWAALNPEKRKANTDRWRAANPDKFRESNKRSKTARQKDYNERQRQDYAAHPEKYLAATRRYYLKNREAMIERAAVHGRTRRALKKNSGGAHTTADIAAILNAQSHRCPYCGANLKRAKRHIDHIVALTRGGSNDRSNIQVLCAACNLSKGAKDPLAFARERGLLL